MTERISLNRSRKKWLLEEEQNIAKALRGKLPPKHFRLDERHMPNKRDWINFYFEYFMTFHVNNFKLTNKLWCDGAEIETLSIRNNRYILSGFLYLLPEGETTPKYWSFIKEWDKFHFSGFIDLASQTDKVIDYKFKIQMDSLLLQCKRKI